MILASYALGVNTAYIYVRGELLQVHHELERALGEAREAGLLGRDIMGSGYSLEIFSHPGGGAYICGEETALIESLEGKRGNPRIKPPFPAVSGLWGRPTVVNNVETLGAIVPVVALGGEEYARVGISPSTGTKLISACGHVERPGVYEIELGLPVEEFLYSSEYCGGIRNGRALKAVIAGGASVPILPASLILRTAQGAPRLMSYESLADGGFVTGTMLGSGGFIVMDETVDIVKNVWNLTRFYHHESCGQCSPCREGTGFMERLLRRLLDGNGHPEDVELLWDLQHKIEGRTICPLGDASAWVVASAIRHFRPEFEAYATRNPRSTSRRLPIHA
jgi:NADH-quinone oxidoreductase subunit F